MIEQVRDQIEQGAEPSQHFMQVLASVAAEQFGRDYTIPPNALIVVNDYLSSINQPPLPEGADASTLYAIIHTKLGDYLTADNRTEVTLGLLNVVIALHAFAPTPGYQERLNHLAQQWQA
ncbi:hypothetical protein [Devosia sp. 1566]|uniref:hypothetical protein n=1 Tax=Devosia sp. 1566 TaxID=2499144 RepID=UPI000FDAFC28|nr:hypothetical protein [Devosia sp. 1566]